MVLNKYYGSFGFSKDQPKRNNDSISSTEHLVTMDSEYSSSNSSDENFFGFSKTSVYFLLYAMFYIVFLSSGAMIFSFLERPTEVALRLRVESVKQNFLRAYPNVTDQALEDLISEVVAASNRGVSAARNASGESNWSFGQSLFFTSTVVTTIGYGHVTPLSRAGKIFCMMYAMAGIPLTLVLLSALVARLLVPTLSILQWLNSKLGHLYQPFNIKILHLIIMATILTVAFLLIPAGIFSKIEPEWDYMDALYYCFISLTTIGLGDYIPGDSPNQSYRPLYKIATTGFLYLGITFLMLTLAVFYDIPQLNLGMLFTTKYEKSEKQPLTGPESTTMEYGDTVNNMPPDPNPEKSHPQMFKGKSRRTDSPSAEEGSKQFIIP